MRNYLFDTSILVASLFETHVHFGKTTPWVQALTSGKIKGSISCHTQAELYATISLTIHGQILSPASCAELVLDRIGKSLEVIDLSKRDYREAIQRTAKKNLRGGVIYDAFHLQAALKKKIPALVTFNSKDFRRLVDPSEIEIVDALMQSPQ